MYYKSGFWACGCRSEEPVQVALMVAPAGVFDLWRGCSPVLVQSTWNVQFHLNTPFLPLHTLFSYFHSEMSCIVAQSTEYTGGLKLKLKLISKIK